MEEVTVATGTIATQSAKAGNDFTLLFDDLWILETAFALATYNVQAAAIRDLHAPVSVDHVHNKMLKLAATLEDIASLYSSGVDNLNVDDISAATAQMEYSGTLSESIVLDLASFCPS